MKTQEITLNKLETRQKRNYILGLYIVFITTLTITFTLVTAIKYL